MGGGSQNKRKYIIYNMLRVGPKKCRRKTAIPGVFFGVAAGLIFHNDFHNIASSNLFVSDRFRGDLPRLSQDYPQNPQSVLLKLRLDGFCVVAERRQNSRTRHREIVQPARQRFRQFGFQMHVAVQHFRMQHAAARVNERKMPAV